MHQPLLPYSFLFVLTTNKTLLISQPLPNPFLVTIANSQVDPLLPTLDTLQLIMSTITDVADVEGWIQHLMQCKQLPEADIKKLCEKVQTASFSLGYHNKHEEAGWPEGSTQTEQGPDRSTSVIGASVGRKLLLVHGWFDANAGGNTGYAPPGWTQDMRMTITCLDILGKSSGYSDIEARRRSSS